MVTAAAASNPRGLRGNAADCLGIIRTFLDNIMRENKFKGGSSPKALMKPRYWFSGSRVNHSSTFPRQTVMIFVLVTGEKI
ncbi:MAG TPA: hypothetical protein VGP28_10600 [Methylocella sp.]|jgi:hypothetical protein|nr:hypothetical protein [Methylocella sp.]